jgi:hypothetical protein
VISARTPSRSSQRSASRRPVSFDVRWHDIQSRRNDKERDYDFAGELVVTAAAIEWSSRPARFAFGSDPADQSVSEYAIAGKERNGVFFK